MKIILSCGGAGSSAGFGAGGPDASRGVLAEQFMPLLAQLGQVERAASAAEGVRLARAAGPQARHLCLALPHELPAEAGMETIPVFGLGLAGCPDRPFAGDPRTDWRARLGGSLGAICLSTHAAEAVRELMGETFPVIAAPPPIAAPAQPAPVEPVTLLCDGQVLDTAGWAETGPPDRAPASPGLEVVPDVDAPPQVWRKTARYRLGVTRLHVAYLYREVVRDLLPAPAARLVARTGRAGMRVAHRLMEGRRTQATLPGDPASLTAVDAGPGLSWQTGRVAVRLDGMVLAAVHGAWDRSWGDALSAFIAACRDEAHTTLVIKTADLASEAQGGLTGYLRRLGPFACRVVIVNGGIEGGLAPLLGASSFYLCASHAEASPLPMMRFLAAGRLAISPAHSALADFVDVHTSFVVPCGPEYESWPGDVEERLGATGWRLDWEALRDGIGAARALARTPDLYLERTQAMARRMAAFCGPHAVLAALAPLAEPDFAVAFSAPVSREGPAGSLQAGDTRPLILVHSETDAETLPTRLGMPEYSYFFVLRFFRPVLERIGQVVAVPYPARDVDRLHAQARARGRACVFLSFAPPHRTLTTLSCPTIPVFAWEFDTIPHEHWSGEARHDWVGVLRRLGRAVVHSQSTVELIRAALGQDFPVCSIPAPVWDGFARPSRTPAPGSSMSDTILTVRGTVIDTRSIDMAALRHDENWIERVQAERARRGPTTEIRLGDVIYGAVFNPEDGRKNWTDMLAAFCRVFRDEPRAALVLKLTHHDGTWGMALMLKHLRRLMGFECRVVLIHGYLPDADYARLVAVTTYAVNTSHGEGQCLPLMEAMSAGKPAVAPPHTGMADYLDETCAFLVRSTAEPSSWPQDTRSAIRTHRRRIDLASLEAAYRESFAVVTETPDVYAAMGDAARERLRLHCSAEVVERLLSGVFSRLERARAAPCDGTVAQNSEDATGDRSLEPVC